MWRVLAADALRWALAVTDTVLGVAVVWAIWRLWHDRHP